MLSQIPDVPISVPDPLSADEEHTSHGRGGECVSGRRRNLWLSSEVHPASRQDTRDNDGKQSMMLGMFEIYQVSERAHMKNDDACQLKCRDVTQFVQHFVDDVDVDVPQLIVACFPWNDVRVDKVQDEAINERNGCGKDAEASASLDPLVI